MTDEELGQKISEKIRSTASDAGPSSAPTREPRAPHARTKRT